MIVYRVTLEPTADNPDILAVNFDLALNDHNRVISNAVFFGVDGPCSDGGGERYPFTFHADGTVDYGSCADSEDRTYKCDLRDVPIESGTLVRIWNDRGTFHYRISAIQPLT